MDIINSHLNLVYVIGGLIALFIGGEGLVRGAVALAEKLKLPKLVIGLTIVGFGTSMPELLVSLQSVQSGAADIAVGNVIGSNIANIFLILGVGALIYPLATKGNGVRRDGLVVVAASAGLLWFGVKGGIDSRAGLIMFGALLTYLIIVFLMEHNTKAAQETAPDTQPTKSMGLLLSLVWIGVGLTLLIFGADYLIKGASAIAREAGVSEAVIGLTLVAVGTSLPELTVSLISAFRRQNEVAVGNVLGSNIFNILGILGITAALKPLKIAPAFLTLDLPLMAVTAVVLCLLIFRGKPIGRLTALVGLTVYGLYTAWLVSPESLLRLIPAQLMP